MSWLLSPGMLKEACYKIASIINQFVRIVKKDDRPINERSLSMYVGMYIDTSIPFKQHYKDCAISFVLPYKYVPPLLFVSVCTALNC